MRVPHLAKRGIPWSTPHLDWMEYPHVRTGWGRPPPSELNGGMPPPLRLDGGTLSSGVDRGSAPPPPPHPKTEQRALATWRAVCLLRERKRTLLSCLHLLHHKLDINVDDKCEQTFSWSLIRLLGCLDVWCLHACGHLRNVFDFNNVKTTLCFRRF